MKKVSLLIILCFVIMIPSICFADDERTVINLIEGTIVKSSEDSTPVYLEDSFIYGVSTENPYIKASNSSYPAYFMSARWEKKVGNSWTTYYNLDPSIYTAGEWRYVADVYIDNDSSNGPSATAGNEYRFTEDVVIKVNNEVWEKGSYSFSSNSSHVAVYKSFTMPEPNELIFYDSDKLNVQEIFANVAIEEKDFSLRVEGGVKPYTFNIVSGPSWLHISSDGMLSGTPTSTADSTTATIKVTDSASNSQQIEIKVAKVNRDPSSRTVVNRIVATSDNISLIPSTGFSVSTRPTFNLTEGYPTYFYKGDWQVKISDDNYVTLGSEDVFEFGNVYRFASTIFIDEDVANGSPYYDAGHDYVLSPDVIVILNGEEMSRGSVSINNNSSQVSVYSKDYLVSDEGIVIPTGTITTPTFDEVDEGYSALPYKAIQLSITNAATIIGTRLKYELTGEDKDAFEVLLNVSSFDGPITFNDASALAVRPKIGLEEDYYSAKLELLYDANNDGFYETSFGKDDLRFEVHKPDPRTVISTITGMKNKPLEEFAVFGNDVDGSKPWITTLSNMTSDMDSIDPIDDNYPAYFYRSSSVWQYKDGENWIDNPTTTFMVGTYRYAVRIYCDNDAGNGWENGGDVYVLDRHLNVYIDDVKWDFVITNFSSSATSGFAYSPEITVEAPAELNFPNGNYKVYKSFVDSPIDTIDVSLYTVGGTAPYVYSKTSGPSWINVSESGIISGTPTTIGENEPLVVRVTDAVGSYLEQTVVVYPTVVDPSDRTIISTVTGSSNISEIAVYGNEIIKPTFNVTDESYPAYFYGGNTYWQKLNGSEWSNVNDTFGYGTYRLVSTIFIDNDDSNGPLATAGYFYRLDQNVQIFVDGEQWNYKEDCTVNIYSEGSSVQVVSPAIVISSNTTEKGDLNEDGNVNIIDVRLILQKVISGVSSPSSAELAVCDLNNDEKINIIDVKLLLQRVIGL